jgi:hypothetical protein
MQPFGCVRCRETFSLRPRGRPGPRASSTGTARNLTQGVFNERRGAMDTTRADVTERPAPRSLRYFARLVLASGDGERLVWRQRPGGSRLSFVAEDNIDSCPAGTHPVAWLWRRARMRRSYERSIARRELAAGQQAELDHHCSHLDEADSAAIRRDAEQHDIEFAIDRARLLSEVQSIEETATRPILERWAQRLGRPVSRACSEVRHYRRRAQRTPRARATRRPRSAQARSPGRSRSSSGDPEPLDDPPVSRAVL